jgi:hypothetical protein
LGAVAHSAQSRVRVLEAFRELGRVDQACEAAKVPRRTFYEWIQRDEEFAAKFEEARRPVADLLEDEAVKRAIAGSDSLLMFLLEHRNPGVFGRFPKDANGQPLGTTIQFVVCAAGNQAAALQGGGQVLDIQKLIKTDEPEPET